MVTHSLTMLEKHLVFTGETPPRNFATNRVKKRSIKSEDPMSHRIIEKRRRDRMNNCLADLSRLIPPEYLKKGRGRIEKTEIIEMAIKHIGHLQNIIASTRFNENSNSSVPSPPATAAISRDPPSIPYNQPLTIKHYRMGYLECMSEAMHFLVEVQGYFAGDSLCVQMINHLRKHCDKILKGNALNFLNKHAGETTSSDSSTSPINGNYNGSPPLGIPNSGGPTFDDSQPNQSFDLRSIDGYCSPKRYSELCCNLKRNSENCYPRYVESDGIDSENRSDSEVHQNLIISCRGSDVRKEESKIYCETAGICQRNYQVLSNLGESGTYENVPLKEENGSSQLREMLTSPTSLNTQVNGHYSKGITEVKRNPSPESNTSGCDAPSGLNGFKASSTPCLNKSLKPTDSTEGNSEFQDGDHHHMMYKFKNNIKQRFSKERRENSECDLNDDLPPKKQKPEDYQKYEDPLMKERLNLLDRTDPEEEKVFKFNADSEAKRRIRYGSESEIQDGDISNRLNFGHRTSEKMKRWEEPTLGFHFQNNQKLWALSPNPSLPFYNAPMGCKALGRPAPEYSSVMNNSFNNLSISAMESGPGIPIFALHAKGSFYIPLTLDHATLAPFLAILGITKSNDEAEEKTVLHPVTISVNFQSHLVR